MKKEVKIPVMGESVLEASVTRIIQASGSLVHQDQEIVELETDKVNQVLYAPASGLCTLTVQIGDIVKIGQVIGYIETATTNNDIPPEKPLTPTQKEEDISPSLPGSRPLVRQAITEKIETAAPPTISGTEVASNPARKKMSSLRKTIAQRLVEVKNSTAMLTTFNEVDMSQIIQIRTAEKETFQKKHGVKLGLLSFFLKASVVALQRFPSVHSYIEGEEIVSFPHFDIGVAVSTEKGLVVPVIRKVDTGSFSELEKQVETLAHKAREGLISVDELRGGTFTITNGGVFGSLFSTPILNPPQSAILGMHAIVKRPVVVEEEIVVRPMMYLALSYDHRLIDGRESVQFLSCIKEHLENPSLFFLE